MADLANSTTKTFEPSTFRPGPHSNEINNSQTGHEPFKASPAAAVVGKLPNKTRALHLSLPLTQSDRIACGLTLPAINATNSVPLFIEKAEAYQNEALFQKHQTQKSLRKAFVSFYEATNQKDLITEMMLQSDVEMEISRRQCFSWRNAHWNGVTPDRFTYRPKAKAEINVQELARNHQRKRMHLDPLSKLAPAFQIDSREDNRKLVLKFVPDPMWPPKEFSFQPIVKAVRSNARGKRKNASATASILSLLETLAMEEAKQIRAKVCCRCHTQKTALWRVVTRTGPENQNEKLPKSSDKTASVGTQGSKCTPVFLPAVKEQSTVTVCNECYLKTECGDLLERKRLDRYRKRIDKELRAKKLIAKQQRDEKRQQKLQQQLSRKAHRAQDMTVLNEVHEDAVDHNGEWKAVGNASDGSPHNKQEGTILTFAKSNSTCSAHQSQRTRKGDRKKKSKKARRKRKYYSESEEEEDYSTKSISPLVIPATSVRNGDLDFEQKNRSGHSSRQSSNRSKGSSSTLSETQTCASPLSRPKRKQSSTTSVDNLTSSIITPRSKRGNRGSTLIKMERPSIEPSRENELRSIGQYCPVCNQVYEDDDAASFVCCDSCEMWVHSACDTDLTPAKLATLAGTNETYICPLCGGR
uniref:Uncharacterized protein AlNc14C11G1360 n=1 Tax=Albugo laibachii Nc14 TaxID=890382 RepID=F0W2Y1_9STRA|nr:conserved hypothetical protein [Albugo laibachii Nc14]|eukprot:CCA15418.1 conserved hypothetical protein [Albugo laibachii Nc14]